MWAYNIFSFQWASLKTSGGQFRKLSNHQIRGTAQTPLVGFYKEYENSEYLQRAVLWMEMPPVASSWLDRSDASVKTARCDSSNVFKSTNATTMLQCCLINTVTEHVPVYEVKVFWHSCAPLWCQMRERDSDALCQTVPEPTYAQHPSVTMWGLYSVTGTKLCKLKSWLKWIEHGLNGLQKSLLNLSE